MASPGMMKRRLTIIKPAPQYLNDVGEMMPDGDPIRYRVWCSWKENAGSETRSEEQEFGIDTITIEFWHNAVFDGIDVQWSVIDEKGNALDIVSVTESGGRRVQISLKCVRRI